MSKCYSKQQNLFVVVTYTLISLERNFRPVSMLEEQFSKAYLAASRLREKPFFAQIRQGA
jgi:hypothetical protein